MSVYPKVEIPPHIRYVLNSQETISKLEKTSLMAGNRWGDTHIIRVDMLEQIWYTTFTFDWLYKDTPELNHIDDVISEVINIKIETLINDKS